jgi:hypothetical protein
VQSPGHDHRHDSVTADPRLRILSRDDEGQGAPAGTRQKVERVTTLLITCVYTVNDRFASRRLIMVLILNRVPVLMKPGK